MGLLSVFGTDKVKETEGSWVDILTNDDDTICRMKLTRMGSSNKQFQRRYAAIQKKFRGNLTGVPTDAEMSSLIDTFIDTVLQDWENVEDIREKPKDNGFPIPVGKLQFMPYNRPNSLLLFKTLPDLFDYVVGEATKRENFQTEANEAEAKNS